MSKTNVSKAKKIYNAISTAIIAVIFVFLVVVVALMLWQRKSGSDSSLFGYYMFEVVTDSMSGTIEPGEVILAKKVDDVNALKEGDIVTFIAPSGQLAGENVTHRIIYVERNSDGSIAYFNTKGDNPNVDKDSWQLRPEQIKAKYVRKSKLIAGLRGFLTKWYGYVVLIALPLTVVGVLIIVGFVRDKVAMEREKLQANSVENMSDEERMRLIEELKKSDTDTNGSNADDNA